MVDNNAGIKPGAVFCTGCGKELVLSSAFCPSCGTPRAVAPVPSASVSPIQAPQQVLSKPVKSKTVAVLLAVFLSYWTWLYTYRANAWKFWTLMPINLVFAVGLNLVAPGAGTVVGVLLAIWPIIDVSVKNKTFYETYWEQFPKR